MFKGFVLPQNAPDKETKLIIEFAQGAPIKVVNLESKREIKGVLELFEYLNMIGSKNGIGMVDMVENRFIGIKSRGVYVAPAATILWAAHKDLESITLDKEVLHLKELFAPIVGTLIYNGLWYTPEMEVLMAGIQQSQKGVSGKVFITLYKGNVIITGRQSENSLYHKGLASMNEHGNFNPEHSEGFIKTLALRLMVN
jgi:argininosuccinate synthase